MNKFDGYIRNIFSEDTLVINVLMDNPEYLSNMSEYTHVAAYVDSDYHNKTPMNMDMARLFVDYVYGLDTEVVIILQMQQLAGNMKQVEYIVNELHWVDIYIASNEPYKHGDLLSLFPVHKPILLQSRIETTQFKRKVKRCGFRIFDKLPRPKFIDEKGVVHKLFGRKKKPRVHNNVCHSGITIIPNGDIFLCPHIAINPMLGTAFGHIGNPESRNITAYSTTICAFSTCRHGVDTRVMNMQQHSIYSHNKGNIKT